MRYCTRIIWVSILLLFIQVAAFAETEAELSAVRQANLTAILHNIERVDRELLQKQNELQGPSAQGRTEQLVEEIKKLSTRLEGLRDNFVEVATGVDPSVLRTREENTEVVWSDELKDLLHPLVNEVRRLTSRPREVDRMRTDLEDLNTQISVVRAALQNLQQAKSGLQEEALKEYITKIESEWTGKEESLSTQVAIAEQKLKRKLSERQTLGESVRNIFQLFFKSRGLNLAVALFCAVLFWTIFRRVFAVFHKLATKNNPNKGLYSRFFIILNIIFSIFGAVLVFMTVLYFVEDWVLLILTIMLILGIVWTSKQAVYQFWTHATMLMNLGAVREGERVIYQGIPWLVRSLNVFSILYNPLLHGAEARLPIKDLSTLRSRDCAPDEPWFPTQQGDWVVMPDGTVGQVILQTVDFVKLKLLGGSIKWYSTEEFMKGCPNVISNGFRHLVSFGVDYKHQKEVTGPICETLRNTLRDRLTAAGYGNEIVKLDVQFEEAASSSLNLAAIVDFSGKAAGEYNRLRRLIQTICVDACTANGWNIPFPHLTVQMKN